MKFYRFLCQFVKISTYKTALAEHLCKLSSGRSMVEMLGVLAIIGVLSLGALNGYSTAMMKYKINKHNQQITELVATIHSLIAAKSFKQQATTLYIAELLNQLNMLPDGVKYGDQRRLETSLSNRIISFIGANAKELTFVITYERPGSNTGTKIEKNAAVQACVNDLMLAKEYASSAETLSQVWIEAPYYYYYGPKKCSGRNPCLTQMSSQDLLNACYKSYNEYTDRMQLYFVFNI